MIADSLLNGISVIIDDALTKQSGDDLIFNIITQIEEKEIPCLKYIDIPPIEEIKHFSNAGFILIDWKLNSSALSEGEALSGVKIGDALEEDTSQRIIDFIIKLKEAFFGPVFIFSAESEETIRRRLEAGFEKLGVSQSKDLLNYIFIKNKSDLANGNFYRIINEWFERSPAIYALIKWDIVSNKAKTDLFWHLYALNHDWPRVFWKIFKEDDTDPSLELSGLISKNFFARLSDCNFSEDLILQREERISKSDIRKLLAGERFISKSQLSPDRIYCGDLFYESNNETFYINIRPECDCISRTSGSDNEVELYLLKGKRVLDADEIRFFNGDFHNFKEKINCVIMPFIEFNGETILIKFKLRDIKVKLYRDMREKRVGRLLPPYVTQIRLKYAGYLQREGFVPTPHEAIFEVDEEEFEDIIYCFSDTRSGFSYP